MFVQHGWRVWKEEESIAFMHMRKEVVIMIGDIHFKFENYGNKSFLTYPIEDRSNMDEVEMEMMRLNDIKGLLPFNLLQSDEHLKCCYNITSMVKLRFIYGSQVNKQKLFQLMEQLALCIEAAQDYMLDINHFVLNPEYIFVNPGDLSMWLVLMPQRQIDMLQNVTLRDFLRGLLNDIRYDYSGDGGEFYINISNYLNSTREVRPKEFRDVLYRYMGVRQEEKKRQNRLPQEEILSRDQSAATSEQAGFRRGRSMDSQQWKAGEEKQEAKEKENAVKVENHVEKNKKEAPKKELGSKGFLKRNKRQERVILDVTGMEIPGQDKVGAGIPGLNQLEIKNLEPDRVTGISTDVLQRENKGKKKTGLFHKKDKRADRQSDKEYQTKGGGTDMGGPIPKSAPKPVLQVQESLQSSEPVSQSPQQMVDASEGTVLIDDVGEDKPFLENARTGSRIYLDYHGRSELRIGRNPEFVDYVIDNPTVGRVHITMIHDKDGYFVIDVNSKNGTFIDRRRIQSNVEEPLKDGCQLRLGTEEYFFYTH